MKTPAVILGETLGGWDVIALSLAKLPGQTAPGRTMRSASC